MRDFGEILAENSKKERILSIRSGKPAFSGRYSGHYKSTLQMGEQCTRTRFTCFPDTLPVT